MGDEDLLKAFDEEFSGFLEAIDEQGVLPEGMRDTASELAKEKDAATLRTLLNFAFSDAADRLKSDVANVAAAKSNALKALRSASRDISAKGFGEKIRTFVTGERDTRIAETNQLRDRLRKLVPDPLQQEAISLMRDFKNRPGELEQFIDGSHEAYSELKPEDHAKAREVMVKLRAAAELALHPTADMEQADGALTDYFMAHLAEGKKLGFLDSDISNEEYITHLLRPKEEEKKEGKLRRLFGGGHLGPRNFKFAKHRSFPTLLHAAVAGRLPRTLNAFDALTIYGERFAKTAAARILLKELKDTGLGKWGTSKSQRAGKVPADWVELARDTHMFRNEVPIVNEESEADIAHQSLFVPPELDKAMQPIFDPDYMHKVPGYTGSRVYQGYIKAIELSLSAFHLKALSLGSLSNEGLAATMRAWMSDMDSPDFEAAERNGVRAGLTTPILGRTIEAYKAIQPSSLPSTAEKIRSVAGLKQIDQAAQAITRLTFDIAQRKFKVTDFSLKDAAWLAKHPNATPTEHFEAQRLIAKELNAIYGGLHWENLGINRTSLGLARALMLAPDWTFSNWFTGKMAFEGGPAGNAARLFWIKSAIWGVALTVGTSLLLSRKQPKDPTRVILGKDKQGRDVTQNYFFTGAPGDLITLAHNVQRYGGFVGLAHSVAGKLGNFAKAGLHLVANQDILGRPIVPRGIGPLKATTRAAASVAKDIIPVPFGISTVARMIMDKKAHYTLPEYMGTIFGGTPPTHEEPARQVHHKKEVSWY